MIICFFFLITICTLNSDYLLFQMGPCVLDNNHLSEYFKWGPVPWIIIMCMCISDGALYMDNNNLSLYFRWGPVPWITIILHVQFRCALYPVLWLCVFQMGPVPWIIIMCMFFFRCVLYMDHNNLSAYFRWGPVPWIGSGTCTLLWAWCRSWGAWCSWFLLGSVGTYSWRIIMTAPMTGNHRIDTPPSECCSEESEQRRSIYCLERHTSAKPW